ncbi:hypothetical protein UC35_13755 [Ramlibacter tataouinensis]|uniref:Signal transduction histidine kinase-like protein n=2 Tax=Ramlibacter tataouinensis TaxID=94132 RepID=A0A127JUS6_9BURK|nr:hypothetical protein UC35_13755 [Ramlibacter tataouinensis]
MRRLAPSMRHHLVVNLQPIGIVYEIMDRRLRGPQPNLAEVHEGAHKISTYARSALNSCLDVITWLAPEEDAGIGAVEGVRECLDLVATSFTFRGFTLRNQVEPVPGRVRRAAMRNVLTGALLHLSDANAPPAEIVLTAAAAASGLRLTLTLTPGVGEAGFPAGPTYRPLSWSDVEALAEAEGVELRREGRELRLVFPGLRGAGA